MRIRSAWLRDVGLALLGAATAFTLVVPAAQAHSSSVFIGANSSWGKWPSSHVEPYFIRNTFPSTAYNDRIKSASAVWAAASADAADAEASYAGLTTVTGNADNPCLASWSAVYWRNISAELLGNTVVGKCGATTAQKFGISINACCGTPWYSGTGTPGGSQWDFYSTMVHEMGHASLTWYGHYEDFPALGLTGVCSPYNPTNPNTADATMCGQYYPGRTYARSLQTHDIHTYTPAW